MHNIALVFHHLRFPCESGGLRSFHILNSLVANLTSDFHLTVFLPSIDSLTGKPSFAYKSRCSDFYPENVSFIFVPTTQFSKKNSISRFISFFIYSVRCSWVLLFSPRSDAYLITTYSLPVLVSVTCLSVFLGSKLWVEVRDLFAYSLMTSKPLLRLIISPCSRLYKFLECSCLRRADLVIPNSPGFTNVLSKEYSIDSSKILTIPLGIDVIPRSFSGLVNSSEDYPSSFDPCILHDSDFSIVYTGSLDKVHSSSHIKAFCESISILPVNVSIHLFGSSSAHFELSSQYSFVHSHGLVPKIYLESILPLFDAALYSSSNKFPYNAILGNKVFDYLKARLPMLFLSKCTASDFCLSRNLGLLCDPATFSFQDFSNLANYYDLNSSFFDYAIKKYNSKALNSLLSNSLISNF